MYFRNHSNVHELLRVLGLAVRNLDDEVVGDAAALRRCCLIHHRDKLLDEGWISQVLYLYDLFVVEIAQNMAASHLLV